MGVGRTLRHSRQVTPISGRGILASRTGGLGMPVGDLAKSHSESHRRVRANRPSQRFADIIVSWAAVNSFLPENFARALNPELRTPLDARPETLQ